MNTLDFFLAPQNGPFTVAAVITLVIAIVQFLSLLLGLGVTEAMDELLPDLDAELDAEADIDADLDLGEPGILEQFFGWLNAGRVPMLVLLIIFLSSFAGTGYAVQAFATGFVGLLPSVLVGPLALAAAFPATRATSRVLGRVLPKDETYAITPEDLVGEIATVTLGPVERETAGKARVMDAHGNLHFVRVRSARPDASFDIGAEILLVRRDGSVFEAITPPAIFNA
ncbi:MAG: DUF1449 family protein [Kiloniellales bacterium]|nr:DUF1449 family protein [Kiloniellales bacterium]